ncbi:MAG TPA: hypothetical protein VG309_05785 [Rhizomicrobium sp.]|jgi:hypothetical protein|nr:hypothetical protein [Rhizomicrobium sp.]
MKLRHFAFPVLFAGVVAGIMFYIAFQENPQGETFDQVSGAINYSFVFGLLGGWFVVALPIGFVIEVIVYLASKAVVKLRKL